MDEVNERFPLTKYKSWVASRASEGLPTAGGVTAAPSPAASLRDVDGAVPASTVGTKNSGGTRPATAKSEEVSISPATDALGGNFETRKSMDVKTIEVEKGDASPQVEEQNTLEQIGTTTSTVDKHPTTASGEEDSDDDDHIHTAVPPELLANPGDSCAICIDTLEEDDDIRGLTCGHAFHAGCLDPWLTSRRACCPLCKADYYVAKPRPEGETDATGRRIRVAQPPASAWTGIRGNHRLMLTGRFAGYAGDGYDYGQGSPRRARRAARREAAAALAAQNTPAAGEAGADGAAGNAAAAAPSRWRPRNPFSSIHIPVPGRAQQTGTAEHVSEPTPAQLEAGTVVR
jgi:Ring finger domain